MYIYLKCYLKLISIFIIIMSLSLELVSLYRNSDYREVVKHDMHKWTSPFSTRREYGGVISDIYYICIINNNLIGGQHIGYPSSIDETFTPGETVLAHAFMPFVGGDVHVNDYHKFTTDPARRGYPPPL